MNAVCSLLCRGLAVELLTFPLVDVQIVADVRLDPSGVAPKAVICASSSS